MEGDGSMLKGIPKIISPALLKVLAEMGHSDRIVIGDGNFPAESVGKNCIVVRADGHGVPELLDAILTLFPAIPLRRRSGTPTRRSSQSTIRAAQQRSARSSDSGFTMRRAPHTPLSPQANPHCTPTSYCKKASSPTLER